MSPRTRRFTAVLFGVVLAAALLRAIVCVELSSHPSVARPARVTDMATYRELALGVLDGRVPDAFYYQPFYYTVYLPVVYRLLGTSPWGVMAVQVLLGAGAVWLTGVTGAHLFGRRAGIAGAVLLALSRLHIFYTPFLLIAVLHTFWIALWTWTVLRAYRRNSWGSWTACAVVGAAATLTRGNVLLLVPLALALAAWRNRERRARGAVVLLLFITVYYLPQLPFSVRNYRHHGRWTGASSAQDAVLALGNTPESPPGGLCYTPTYEEWMGCADLPHDRRVPVARQALRWALAEPFAYAELKLRMFLLFWHREEIPNNVGLATEGRASRLLQTPLLTDFGAIGALGILGLLVSVRRSRRSASRLFVHGSVIVYCLGTVLFYILARFRLPVFPLLCVFGGHALDDGVRTWRAWRRGAATATWRLSRFALFAVFSLLIVRFGFPLYHANWEPWVTSWARPDGVVSRRGSITTVYDHGPLLYGGWERLPASGTAARFLKEFRLPAGEVGVLSLPSPTLRIPVQTETGCQTQWMVLTPGGDVCGTLEKTLAGSGRVQWAEVELSDVPVDSGAVRLAVEVKTHGGELHLIVDGARRYGRTWVVSASGRAEQIQAEAGVELRWGREGRGGGDNLLNRGASRQQAPEQQDGDRHRVESRVDDER